MSEIIKQSELRNDNAAIMRRVAAGESFTVTVNGVPVADLVPHQRSRKRVLIPAAEVDAMLRDLPPIDYEEWKRDIAEIDYLLHDTEIGPPQEDEDPR
ncbi:prevent-host-death family protein [Pseudonocardia eucalypti]|uniref:type II toxin-antitoxin system Phd/YefM family antitoxin n=1 Tax=Pseudonocardia eucalypti TaxID=648755 RepID=UPI0018557DCB|nr:prevent-host-death family protein [Pseudonocardia eucalypti]